MTPFKNYEKTMEEIRRSASAKMEEVETLDEVIKIKNDAIHSLAVEYAKYVEFVRQEVSDAEENFEKIKDVRSIETSFVEKLSYYQFAKKESSKRIPGWIL